MKVSFRHGYRLLGVLALVTAIGAASCGPTAQPTATPTKAPVATPTAARVATSTAGPAATPTPTRAVTIATATVAPPTPTVAPPTPTPRPGAVFGQFSADPDKVGVKYPYGKPDFALPPKRGGVLRIAHTLVWPHFDVNATGAAGTLGPTQMVYNKLVSCKGPLEMTVPNTVKCEPAPSLAESWQLSGDGKVWTFNLRKGVKWQNLPPVNGREFTSDDVKYTWELYKKGGTNAATFAMMDKVETPDKYTVKLTLNQPYPDFIFTGIAERYTYIYPHEIADRDGDFKKTLVGTGPFQVKQIYGKERIAYERNPAYFVPGAPFLDGIEYNIVVDAATVLAAFRAGLLHFGVSGITPREMRAMAANTPDALFYVAESAFIFHMSVRLDKPPFSDVRVRRAVSMAIDRPGIIKDLWDGEGVIRAPIPWQFIFDSRPGLEQQPYYRYNPAEAKKLLGEAGYPDGFSFKANYYPYTETGPVTPFVVDGLRAVGVKMELKPEDYTSSIAAVTAGTFEQAAAFPPTRIWASLDGWLYGNMHTGEPLNFGKISVPELDKLLEAQRLEADPAKRSALAKKIFDMEVDQLWRIPLPKAMDIRYQSKKVHNYVNHEMMIAAYNINRQLEYMWLE